jgi:RNA polymerase primary sigma factor
MSSEEKEPKTQGHKQDPTFLKYLKEIGSIPLLTKEEEAKYAKLYQDTRDEVALKKLIISNLKFVVNVAKKYHGCGILMSDLVDEGNIGLIEAAKRFDPTKNTRLITYAIWWIRQAIANAIASQGGIVRIPIKQASLAYNVKKAKQELSQKLSRDPTIQEIADEIGIKKNEVNQIVEISKNWIYDETSPEDISIDDLTKEYKYNLRSVDYRQSNNSLKEEIQHLLNLVSPQESKVLKLRFGLDEVEPMTLEKVGKIMNLSKERIRQIEENAIGKIRKNVRYSVVSDILN